MDIMNTVNYIDVSLNSPCLKLQCFGAAWRSKPVVAAQGWNEGFSENQFMEKNVIKVSVDPNRLDTP